MVGPKACGKSARLRALARLIDPTKGQVRPDRRTGDVGRSNCLLIRDQRIRPHFRTTTAVFARSRWHHRS
ncbi:hypothetical protein ACI3KS_13915 [Microbacterium sp. ZW T5_45]|uniref:hypothetical protein n=1 Tax=Microbacterium sp. ZW T5_45 TaxID=3378080 RepID=UPI0038537346